MKKSSLWLLVPIGFGIAILIPASLTPNLFLFKPFGWDEVGRLLSFLILIALFLERALEVFITTWRRPGEEGFDNDIQACERRITELKGQIELKSSQPETTAETEKTTTGDPAKLEERTKVGSETHSCNLVSRQALKAFDIKLSAIKYEIDVNRFVAVWSNQGSGARVEAEGD